MGIKEFKIYFDNSTATYYPGQTVTGRVYISADKSENVRSVKLHIKGEANTKWTSSSTHSVNSFNVNSGQTTQGSQYFTGHEKYFDTIYFLLGSEGDSQVEIPFGDQYYQFACPLPTNLPTSFEDNTYGHVRYTVKAVLDRPWKFDDHSEEQITIVDPFDLNLDPRSSQTVQEERSKKFCCFCCATKPLNLIVSLPSRGFVPEQTIPVRVAYDNMSGVQIKKIKIKLEKVITFHAHSPHAEKRTKNHVLTHEEKFPAADDRYDDFITKITIPQMTPSNMRQCKIIDIDYYVVVKMYTSRLYRNFEHKVLILIGTTPLANQQPVFESNFSTSLQNQEPAFDYGSYNTYS